MSYFIDHGAFLGKLSLNILLNKIFFWAMMVPKPCCPMQSPNATMGCLVFHFDIIGMECDLGIVDFTSFLCDSNAQQSLGTNNLGSYYWSVNVNSLSLLAILF